MIIAGDCLDAMAAMEPESVDAIVTDPPYGLSFMGKAWDHGVPARPFWEAMFRVAKPGAYLLAFGGTRTVHRIATNIEDAGWIIRDMLVWGYASGFPKSKASLKPAWEPIVMARKPGPLRMLAIDECRIGIDSAERDVIDKRSGKGDATPGWGHVGVRAEGERFTSDPSGRWPANIVLTDPIFDGGVEGVVGGGETVKAAWGEAGPTYEHAEGSATTFRPDIGVRYGDSGTYSRFFSLPSYGRSDTLSGIIRSCRTCGAPIAESPSTGRTRPPDTAPPTAATTPGGSLAPAVSDAGGLFDSHETATAPRRAATPSDGMLGSMATEAKSPTATDTSGIETSTSPVAQPDTTSPSEQPASPAAAPLDSSDTTTTTISPWMCGSCADSAIGDSTLQPRQPSELALLPVDQPNYPRFYLVAKSARSDREPVLGGLPVTERKGESVWTGECNVCGSRMMLNGKPTCGHDDFRWVQGKARANHHPTVKPTDLMRHLVRLVTPTGGTVLDPFLGSGTTGLAAEMEGFEWIGIEREAEYVRIAEARLNGTQRGLGLDVGAPTPKGPTKKDGVIGGNKLGAHFGQFRKPKDEDAA